MRLSPFLAAVLLAECSGSSTPSRPLSARSATAGGQPPATATAIVLTRVRIALEKIELRSRDGDRRAEIALGPVVIDLSGGDLDGKLHRVFDSTVPAGTYDKIEFEIHPLERATTCATRSTPSRTTTGWVTRTTTPTTTMATTATAATTTATAATPVRAAAATAGTTAAATTDRSAVARPGARRHHPGAGLRCFLA